MTEYCFRSRRLAEHYENRVRSIGIRVTSVSEDGCRVGLHCDSRQQKVEARSVYDELKNIDRQYRDTDYRAEIEKWIASNPAIGKQIHGPFRDFASKKVSSPTLLGLEPAPAVAYLNSKSWPFDELDELILTSFAQRHTVMHFEGNCLIDLHHLESIGYDPKLHVNILEVSSQLSNARSAPESLFLSPAPCLQVYPTALRRYEGSIDVYTVIGKAFREEGLEANSDDRLREFLMREFIFVGDVNQIEIEHSRVLGILYELGKQIDPGFQLLAASDTFLGRDSHSQLFSQLVSDAKIELRCANGDHRIAVASLNRHGGFFASRLRPELEDVETMCVGFGYNRILSCANWRGAS